MTAMRNVHDHSTSRGFTLIEVLVSIVILAVGLLGLALLQSTALSNQLEAYQRGQAMLSLEDMANRIRVNRVAAMAGAYVEDDDYGLQAEQDCTVLTVTAARDLCYWNTALAGSDVTLSGANVGSVVGALGCITQIPGSVDGEMIIRLTIAWQGMTETLAPSSDCGEDAFGDDRFRRVASIDTVLANLNFTPPPPPPP
jgi:type IV pilus assembly protein PilV